MCSLVFLMCAAWFSSVSFVSLDYAVVSGVLFLSSHLYFTILSFSRLAFEGL